MPAICTPVGDHVGAGRVKKYAYAPPAESAVPPTAQENPGGDPDAAAHRSARCTPRCDGAQSPATLAAGALPVRRLPLGARTTRARAASSTSPGHIPGASFLDVDADLSDLSVPDAGRHPLPSAERVRRAPRPGRASGRACSSSPTGRSAAPSGSGGCSGTSATTTAPCSSAGSTPGAGRCARARRQIEPAEFVPRERTDDTIDGGGARATARRSALVLVDARTRAPLARRAEPDRRPAGPHSRGAERAVGGAAAGAAGGRARRVLRLRRQRLRRAPPRLAPRPGRGGSIPARGASGRSAACRSSAASSAGRRR